MTANDMGDRGKVVLIARKQIYFERFLCQIKDKDQSASDGHSQKFSFYRKIINKSSAIIIFITLPCVFYNLGYV